ncbi:MAG: nitrilase family protein [Candidatus Riflebacteria bacterium]|nr:nitrilase family protein [Candidatus Riflebacteria bacterium]
MRPDLTLTLIQTSLAWENPAANLEMLQKKIEAVRDPGDVIVLPEMFTTGFSMRPEAFAEPMDGRSVRWMRELARKAGAVVCGSLIIGENDRFFNRFIWMPPTGESRFYAKRHLFTLGGEDRHYAAGSEQVTIAHNGWRIRPLICFDLRFPVWLRNRVVGNEAEYDLLLCVASWPDRRAFAWRALMPARAIENQCFAVAVNRVGADGNGVYHTGDSMVVDPLGETLLALTHLEVVATVTLSAATLDDLRRQLPFLAGGDRFTLER